MNVRQPRNPRGRTTDIRLDRTRWVPPVQYERRASNRTVAPAGRIVIESPLAERKALRTRVESQLLDNLPSLKGKPLLRNLSNLLTSPHLNKIELGHAMVGTYWRILEDARLTEVAKERLKKVGKARLTEVEKARLNEVGLNRAEKAWIAREMRDITQRLHSEITHSPEGIHMRRRSPK